MSKQGKKIEDIDQLLAMAGSNLSILEEEVDIQAPESSLNQDSLKTDIERSFAALSVREATILSMYYGLNGYSSMSLEEIGTKLGLTSERVRQVKTKAIRKLKEVKNNKRLKTYL